MELIQQIEEQSRNMVSINERWFGDACHIAQHILGVFVCFREIP